MISTLDVASAGRLWYPVMLAQESGEISESKGAELLGLSVIEYRIKKQQAIQAVKTLVETLPSPLISLVDILRERPELLRKSPS
jgi:predicted regulator of amino acid metabolism with ACT domain